MFWRWQDGHADVSWPNGSSYILSALHRIKSSTHSLSFEYLHLGLLPGQWHTPVYIVTRTIQSSLPLSLSSGIRPQLPVS